MAKRFGESGPEKTPELANAFSELTILLDMLPGIFGDRLGEIKEAVRNAEIESKIKGALSPETIQRLNDLYEPFKIG